MTHIHEWRHEGEMLLGDLPSELTLTCESCKATADYHLEAGWMNYSPTTTATADGPHSEPQGGCTCTRYSRVGATWVNPLCPQHGDARETGVVR